MNRGSGVKAKFGSIAKMNRRGGVKMNFRWKSAPGCDIMSSDIISQGNVSCAEHKGSCRMTGCCAGSEQSV